MDGLEVLAPGLFTTVQDLGRPGCARFGVPDSGALDAFALQAANMLVGNDPGAAGLEVTQPGLALRTTRPAVVAAAGGDLGMEIDGVPAAPWCVYFVGRGAVLHFAARRRGVRSYLAFAGGVDVPPVMGSRSTHVRGGFGGWRGRPLRRGDVLPIGRLPRGEEAVRRERAGLCLPRPLRRFGRPRPVRVVAGPQAYRFAPVAWHRLVGGSFVATNSSDRMGLRLAGPALPYARDQRSEFVSDGVVPGSIQVPGDGRPIVLLADGQTTGGYPKIATVVSADLDFLAHAWPGEPVAFRCVDMDEARRLRRARRRLLEEVARFTQGL